MNFKELELKISTASELAWFNSKIEEVKFNYINVELEFKSVASLFKFIDYQIEGWLKLNPEFASALNNSLTHFTTLKSQIEYFVENFTGNNSDGLEANWVVQVKPHLNRALTLFTYDCPETLFLEEIYKNKNESFQGALQYFLGNTGSITTKDYFNGAILAYEFISKGTSEIVKRSNKEAKSLNEIKRRFQNQLDESEIHLVEHLEKTTAKYNLFTQEIDNYKTEKVKVVDEWFENSQNIFNEFSTKATDRQKELEKTYEELLRLKKPAEYWKLRAAVLNEEGWKAVKWVICLVSVACIALYFLLWQTPEGMLKSFFSEDKGTALKWSIIFVTFLSFLAYGIKAITKVMFSSFHLARDAEEKEQLTYVYLSLIKDNGADDKDRTLIMQSLFSRADSGLLKEDSSPTMPSGLLDKIR